jgi:hypothetical protein
MGAYTGPALIDLSEETTDNWRRPWSGWQDGTLAHPDSPVGGGGPGRFRSAVPHDSFSDVPASRSPVGRALDWLSLGLIDKAERVESLCKAVLRAPDFVAEYVKQEVGRSLDEILHSIVPMLVLSVATVATTTVLGGAIGAVVGALAGGVGAVPGAVAGGEIGLDVGLALLEWMGIGFLIVYVSSKLGEVLQLAGEGVQTAWDAPSHPDSISARVDQGARQLAHSVAVLVRLLLEAIVAYLLKEGFEALPSLVGKLRRSRLGQGFATWIETNWRSLVEDSRLRPAPRTKAAAAGSEEGPPTHTTEPPAKPPEPSRPPMSFPEGIPPEEGARLTQAARSTYDIKGRNVAVAESNIDGSSRMLTSVSGKASPEGTVPAPTDPMFTTKPSGAMTRAYDSEVKILEDVAKDLNPNSQGTISLYTERSPCLSCQGVIQQFQERFPGVNVIVTHGQ